MKTSPTSSLSGAGPHFTIVGGVDLDTTPPVLTVGPISGNFGEVDQPFTSSGHPHGTTISYNNRCR